MKSIFCLVLVFFAPVSYASAEIAFELHVTPSGLPFWHHLRPDLPKDTMIAGWRDGVGFTTPGKEALSLVGSRMIMRAARAHAPDNLLEALRDIGADGNISSDGWSTYATLTGSAGNFAAAAGLAQRVLAAPLPDLKELDRIESRLSEETNGFETQAEAMATRAAFRLAEPTLPWTRLYDGAGFRRITLEDVDAWRKRVLARDNVVIAVEGPTSAEDFGTILDDLAKGLPRDSDAPVKPEIVFSAKPRTIVIESDQPQTFIAMFAPTDIRLDRDRLKYVIGVGILGGGFESRIYEVVRQQLGATYGVHANLSLDRDHEQLVISGAVANERAVEALAAIKSEYARWRADGATPEEFAAAANRIKASIAEYAQKSGGAPMMFVNAMLAGNPPNAPFDFAERIAGYSLASLNADILQHFPEGPLFTVIVAPSAAPFDANCVIKSWEEVEKCR